MFSAEILGEVSETAHHDAEVAEPSFREIIKLVVGEMVSKTDLIRRPEPHVVMDDFKQVATFHAEGEYSLSPIYHLNALSISALAPRGGTVLDLGSGSAQAMIHLARVRPDLKIIGLEQSQTMIEWGRNTLNKLGLADKIELREGDMCDFIHLVPEKIDVVTSLFSLHHLPNAQKLTQCVNQISLLQQRDHTAVWVFDHVRPKTQKTAEQFPKVFIPTSSEVHQEDSKNSLMASWSFEELSCAIKAFLPNALRHGLSSVLNLYQVHWMGQRQNVESLEQGVALNPVFHRQFKNLKNLFGKKLPF